MCTPVDLTHLHSVDHRFASLSRKLGYQEFLYITGQMWDELHCNLGNWQEYDESRGGTLWIAVPDIRSTCNKFREIIHLIQYILTINRTQQNAIESMIQESVHLRECPRYPTCPESLNISFTTNTKDPYLNRLRGVDILNQLQRNLSVVLPFDFLNFLLNFSHRLSLKQPDLPWNFSNHSRFLFFGPEDTLRNFRLLRVEEYTDSGSLDGEHPSHVLHNRRSPQLNAEWKRKERKLLLISQSSSGDRLLLDVTHPKSSTFGWIYVQSTHPVVFNTCNPQFLDFSITDFLYRVTHHEKLKLKSTWFHSSIAQPNLGKSLLL
ncbi:hypothetical protein K7432_007260 [Basidiobolus ranarum]|uniref:Maturase K n=1 Tax=Basidiobolus ranarum TaxID=34480 RepID=A0ABR2W0D5_9FUNG